MIKRLLLPLALTLFAHTASAQSVVNPTKIQWDTPDYAISNRYDVQFSFVGATAPIQTVSIDKASLTPIGGSTYEASLPKPFLGSPLVVVVRACGLGADNVEVCSDWSDISNQFKFTPKKPTNVGTK